MARNPINLSRPFGRVKRHVKENKTGINFTTGQPLTPGEKSWRGGYDQGVKDTYNAVKAAVNVKPEERLPEGKGIDAGLFNIQK